MSKGTKGIGVAGLAVTAAGVLTNLLGYVVPLIGARRLSAADLSALATILAITAIAGVASTGLQIAVAVHRARHGASSVTRSALLTVVVIAGALAVALPIAVLVLHLPALATVLAGISTVGVVAAGRWLGEMQGDQRFLPLAVGLAVLAGGRYGGVIAGLAAGLGLTTALLLGAATAVLVLPVLHLLARRPGVAAEGEPLAARAVLTAGGATLAMLVVSYADLILARRFLPFDASGEYSVGTVLTKGALWAPQVVTIMALPRLAQADRRTLRIALALVTACGVVLVAGAAVAGGFAFRLAGGPDYVSLGRYAPIFAATGAVYGLLFVLINAQVAAGAKWPAAPLWICAAGFVLAAWLVLPHTLPGIAWGALGTAVVCLAATSVLVGLRLRASVTAPRPEHATLSID
ncbi:polysaccharide biosynthesis protein [Paractinoplanes lichenicola]|uniref:Polysaccharide biosynthesis protein n=1 Tax=Paractinoplanes lichenicola TaxID=2802976 RepID=A0ABS1VVN0_9ACTN|nr:polysaccharide biosynthesis protein [Actinoplanes lichenicola]MBL7258504.1 polysaccharide biosynthesis protein [Actinoplanes lichenicola]